MDDNIPLGLAVGIAAKRIRRDLDALTSQYDNTSGIQGQLLGALAHAESEGRDVFQKDIERLFGSRRSSVNNVISTMEQNGYLNRVPVQEDARLKKLVLTEKGRTTEALIHTAIAEYENTLSAGFTEEELLLFRSFLKRLIYGGPCTEHNETMN